MERDTFRDGKKRHRGRPLLAEILSGVTAFLLIPTVVTGFIFSLAISLSESQIMDEYGLDIRKPVSVLQTVLSEVQIIMLIILMILAVLFGLWAKRSLLDPLKRLEEATHLIQDGNLEFSVKTKSIIREVRDLCDDFEKMRIRLKTAGEDSVQADIQNRELITNISHDLKTPLTSVRGYVEGLMDGVADTPEKRERYLRTIYSKTAEMEHLINELAFYTKISTNKIPYAFARMNAVTFFAGLASELEDDLKTQGIQFRAETDIPEKAEIVIDAEQMSRVISNIISNAVKYMDKEEKKITLEVSADDDEVTASFTDNGKGISREDIGLIFDRFYRTDSSRNSGSGGSGIGLSIVRKIIEDHGGRVWADSSEGKWTRITFALKRADGRNERGGKGIASDGIKNGKAPSRGGKERKKA